MKKVKDNTIGKCLKDILDNSTNDFKILVNRGYLDIDDDRKVEVSLAKGINGAKYTFVSCKLVSKTRGELDSQRFSIKDTVDEFTVSGRHGICKYVWVSNGKVDWYGKPTKKDLNDLAGAVDDYVDIWR